MNSTALFDKINDFIAKNKSDPNSIDINNYDIEYSNQIFNKMKLIDNGPECIQVGSAGFGVHKFALYKSVYNVIYLIEFTNMYISAYVNEPEKIFKYNK